MTLTSVLIFIGLAVCLGFLARNRWRLPLLLVTSALTVYALQPALPIRFLDFWLPTATLALTVLGWVLTAPPEQRDGRANGQAAAILAGVVITLGLTRLLGLDLPGVARPPRFLPLLLAVTVARRAMGIPRASSGCSTRGAYAPRSCSRAFAHRRNCDFCDAQTYMHRSGGRKPAVRLPIVWPARLRTYSETLVPRSVRSGGC
mgnify:CR=1 FL=1